MKFSFVFLISLVSSQLFSAPNHKWAVVDQNHIDPIAIYEKPGKHLLAYVYNNPLKRDFLTMEILSETATHFYVTTYYSHRQFSCTGWVEKKPYICVVHHSLGGELVFFKKRNKAKKHQVVVPNTSSETLTIEAMTNRWMLISTVVKNQFYRGWVIRD